MRSLITCAAAFGSAFVLTAPADAAQFGSSMIGRPRADPITTVVAVYVGTRIPANERVDLFRYFAAVPPDGSTPNPRVTPLLLEETAPGFFVVRAIGTNVVSGNLAQVLAAPFGPIAGSAITTNGNFTFGLVNAGVSEFGVVQNATTGAVSFNAPPSAGAGLSGPPSTNRWIWTTTAVPITNLVVGTTSIGPAPGVTYQTGFPAPVPPEQDDRTYSASIITTSVPAPCPGDLTGDNAINTADLTVFLGRFGQTATPGSPAAAADFNNDGVVNTPDLTFFLGRFGSVCAG
ncbi:MAG: GC-type dockerin domain-anchored protein [Phycisphaerales bacterium]